MSNKHSWRKNSSPWWPLSSKRVWSAPALMGQSVGITITVQCSWSPYSGYSPSGQGSALSSHGRSVGSASQWLLRSHLSGRHTLCAQCKYTLLTCLHVSTHFLPKIGRYKGHFWFNLIALLRLHLTNNWNIRVNTISSFRGMILSLFGQPTSYESLELSKLWPPTTSVVMMGI